MTEFKKYYFECSCGHDGHRLVFTLDEDHDYPELWLDIFLDDVVWYKRLWKGIKYIFGYKCSYGHFGNWSLTPEDADKLKNAMLDYKKALNASKTAKDAKKAKQDKPLKENLEDLSRKYECNVDFVLSEDEKEITATYRNAHYGNVLHGLICEDIKLFTSDKVILKHNFDEE